MVALRRYTQPAAIKAQSKHEKSGEDLMSDRKRILIVENHPDNGRFLAEHFTSAGHEASWTKDADAAIRHCINSRPDIIIIDMRVAGTNGKSLLEDLKSFSGLEQIPVICMAADLN